MVSMQNMAFNMRVLSIYLKPRIKNKKNYKKRDQEQDTVKKLFEASKEFKNVRWRLTTSIKNLQKTTNRKYPIKK